MGKQLKMRLTLAGIPNERILVLKDRADVQKYAGQMVIDKVFFINDADPAASTKDILESIVS